MFSGNTKLLDDAVDYTLDAALASARAEAELDDFGTDEFVEPLRLLIKYSTSEIPFKPAGLYNFKTTIQRYLVNRLRLARDLKDHPEILEEDVSDPIMILGMPRTGTTKLQRLLSADSQNQSTAFWRLLNPAPFPGETANKPEDRIAFAKIVEDALRANTTFTSSHEVTAEEAEESSYLPIQSFDHILLYSIYPSASYLEWTRSRSPIEAYRYKKKLLQYLQWQDGGRKSRRWILKNPGALGHLSPLVDVFPHITFVQSHRNLAEVLPSYCRLIETMLEPLVELGDLHEFGQAQIDYWNPEFKRNAEQRKTLGAKLRIIDEPYLNIVKDPVAIARKVYELAGMTLSSEGEEKMRQWSRDNEQHKHGKAEYSLARYGLTEVGITDAFGHLDDEIISDT